MNASSDSDENDVDFVPEEKVCSDDDDDSQSDEIDEESETAENPVKKGNKRSLRGKKNTNNTKRSRHNKISDEVVKQDPKDEKKHEEDLWASFLKTDGSINTTSDVDKSSSVEKCSSVCIDDANTAKASEPDDDLDGKLNIGNHSSTVLNTAKPTNISAVRRRPGMGAVSGGLSSILNKIGKNSKLSTLEKSKNDWNSFKKDEGIEEEISGFNRGRDGYLERQDFLQRTDVRQFEIEKDLRTIKRSNR